MTHKLQAEKTDYRRRRDNQPKWDEREQLRAKLYNFSNQKNVAKLFKTSSQNIYAAFEGRNASLMNKIKIYIEKMQTRKTA